MPFVPSKAACPEMIVMPDVALDPYSIYGHESPLQTAMLKMIRRTQLW
jgi:delta-aminolevulinic acid dehydratase/porphobilinogen synthase